MSQAVSVGNSQQSTSLLGVFVWSLATLFYFYEFLLQTSPNVMETELLGAFQINATELGVLISAYGWAYAATQIPAGITLDRLGPRRLLTLASVSCGVGSLMMAMTNIYTVAFVGRLLMGFGGGFAVVGCMKIASIWLPPQRFAMWAGLMVTVGMLGAASGQKPLAMMMDAMNWQKLLEFGGFFGIGLAVLMWVSMRKSPKTAEEHAHIEHHLWRDLKGVCVNPQSWWAAIYAGLMFAPTIVLGVAWGVPYLSAVYDIPRTVAAETTTLLFIGFAIGGPVFGYWSDRLGRRLPPMYTSAILLLMLIIVVLFVPVSLSTMNILFFAIGFVSPGFVMAFSVIKELNKPHLTGTAIGFINTLNTLVPYIFLPIVGKLLDMRCVGTICTAEDFQVALMMLPACIGLALLVLPLLKETHCRHV